MATVVITKELIAHEDIEFADGNTTPTATFSRTTSTGGSQTLHKISDKSVPVEDTNSYFTATDLASVLDEIHLNYLLNANMVRNYFPGAFSRAAFSYADDDQITIGPGSYLCAGKVCTWASDLTSKTLDTDLGGAPSNNTFYYLYIDYSAVTSGTALTNAEFVWSATEPSWSDTYQGWYNGSDRAIFAVWSNASGNIDGFYNDGTRYVQLNALVNVFNNSGIGTSWDDSIDVQTSGGAPGIVSRVKCRFLWEYADAAAYCKYRVKGSSSDTGLYLCYVSANSQKSVIMTDVYVQQATGQFEVEESSASSNTLTVHVQGWYLPQGM